MTLFELLRWLWPAAHIAMALWDDESYELLSARHVELARESGLLAVLPTALTTRIVACGFAGEFDAADRLIVEMRVLTDAMDVSMPSYGPLFVSGWRGEEATLAEMSRAVAEENSGRGEGAGLAFGDYARAGLTTASDTTKRRSRRRHRSTPSTPRASSSTPPGSSS